MTLRQKIADWISGGELTRLRRDVTVLVKANDKAWDMWAKADASRDTAWAECGRKGNALRQIIAQETPRANATARRMAAIAKGALE